MSSLTVVGRRVKKSTDEPGVEFLGGPPAGCDEIESVKFLTVLDYGVIEVGEGIQRAR